MAIDVSGVNARTAQFDEFIRRHSWTIVPMMAVGFAVWQPTLQWLFHLINGRDLPFHTMAEWRLFIAAMLVVGTIAGFALSYALRRKPGVWRQWLELLVLFAAVAPFTVARQVSEMSFVPSVATIIVSGLLAATLLVYPVVWVKRALAIAQGRAPSA